MLPIVLLLGLSILVPSVNAADNLEDCRFKLIELHKHDALVDLDYKPPEPPKVVVGKTFFNIPFDLKEKVVGTVNCVLMEGKDANVDFLILEHMNHHVVGKWRDGKLEMK